MTIQQIESFLQQIPAVRALVVGDLMLDEYLWGRTSRISPEAPVPVVDVTREDQRLGGAGNVVNNLRVLGAHVMVCSVLGDDEDGRFIFERLEKAQVDVAGVVFDARRTTSRKTRILASHQQMLRIDRESRQPLSPEVERHLLREVEAHMGRVDVIFLSDYGKGVLTDPVLHAIISAGKGQGIPVVVDPKGEDYRKYRGATLLTPNRSEASQASGLMIDDESSLCRAGAQLLRDVELEALVLTRSEEGMSLFQRNRPPVHLPTKAREVYDVSGAGDTVLALIGIGLAAGLKLEQAATVANLAAGVVVGKLGTSTVSRREILEAAGLSAVDRESNIQDAAALQIVLRRLQQLGKKIVFTNGCFDLLHAGHVSYLQKARDLGDVLVLGLNSDDSVRRLKGETRPLVSQQDRATVLAALGCVDYVVIFDEDTPLQLIETLRPDILVKGADYRPETVVGREQVESWGGRVELIEFVEGRSTTGLIQKMLQS
ncbi:MAG: bifunctional D-glycero-beta-D-manno-heptose-7-phosphate kinase/D-glycero-beta-D-manno-heptose 1-phosphate adenylyltransferase HldE [Desulfuromonadaceae bacterium]|nr:bifunctional D-glycero-beta-D-manno-heptose-7-phosphate kinase/D-glycero-beta-D-manno-heptose 1-phosphate adenylyltransferase HldE [Desulfuromonadaceae bacterium]